MTIFTIDEQNSITAFGCAEEAATATATPFDSFSSQQELADLALSGPPTGSWPSGTACRASRRSRSSRTARRPLAESGCASRIWARALNRSPSLPPIRRPRRRPRVAHGPPRARRSRGRRPRRPPPPRTRPRAKRPPRRGTPPPHRARAARPPRWSRDFGARPQIECGAHDLLINASRFGN